MTGFGFYDTADYSKKSKKRAMGMARSLWARYGNCTLSGRLMGGAFGTIPTCRALGSIHRDSLRQWTSRPRSC